MSYLGPSLRRRRPRTWTGWRAVVATAASVALNLLVLRLVQVDWVGVSASKGDVRPVGLAPISADRWAANRKVTDGSRPVPPPVAVPVPAPKPPEPTKAPGQVVDVAPSANDKPPKDSRFVAESNNTVEKETISRFRRPGFDRAAPQPTQSQAPRTAQAPKGEEVAPLAGIPGLPGGDVRRPGAPGAPAQKAAPPQKVAMSTDPEGLKKPPEPTAGAKTAAADAGGARGEGGQGASQAGTGGRPILLPTAAFYDQFKGGPAPDHVEGVDVGDATFLNTREWKFAGFFNRVKQAISEHWDPTGAMRSRDPTGEKFFYKDRSTLLSVTLNDQGAVTSIRVARSSGLDFLDQTAVDAFEKAQPFPNPPRGLVDSHGEISFQFGFFVETGGGAFRFFRGASH
ncbi:MAG TPA: energy transducer TonB [Anaeromyxobacteraceae bacterium]|nr:energy transducer TonB [Anaeromyxobacteraceae bacterium]